MLRLNAACLRGFSKFGSTSQDKWFVWKGHWKQLGWDQKVGRVGDSSNHQGRSNSVSQVDEDSDMAPGCWSCGGEGSTKEQWPLLAPLSEREICLFSPHPEAWHFHPFHMSLMPFMLQDKCWSSEPFSQSRFMCRPFKKSI